MAGTTLLELGVVSQVISIPILVAGSTNLLPRSESRKRTPTYSGISGATYSWLTPTELA
jgi:hypothetical protein